MKRIVVAQDVVQDGTRDIALHVRQMEKALAALRVLGHLARGQHRIGLHRDARGVVHFILRAAGVDILAVNRQGRVAGVKILIRKHGRVAAVDRIGKFRAEARKVKVLGAAADLLVGRKGDAQRAVGDVLA